jgi:hypothetical protein
LGAVWAGHAIGHFVKSEECLHFDRRMIFCPVDHDDGGLIPIWILFKKKLKQLSEEEKGGVAVRVALTHRKVLISKVVNCGNQRGPRGHRPRTHFGFLTFWGPTVICKLKMINCTLIII